jgi:hypothetical protein
MIARLMPLHDLTRVLFNHLILILINDAKKNRENVRFSVLIGAKTNMKIKFFITVNASVGARNREKYQSG